ncbi:MAG TPA: hypothetical protein VFW87_14120 [Pirellulales bacterium]|nr:hypothetical protein [Pirellulales bacterium]
MKRLIARLSLAAALASAGCTTIQPRTVRIDSAAGMYSKVNLNYRVDTGQLSEPLMVSRIAGRRIRQQQIPSSPYANHSVSRLTIEYPHPEGKQGYALAEVVIETRAPRPANQRRKPVWRQWTEGFADAARELVPGLPMSDTVYEAWSMDLPRVDLDRAIGGLSQGGFFVSPPRPAVGVELATRIDGYQSIKRWTHVPELDTLVERVRQEGQLVSYTHPIDRSQPATAIAGQDVSSGDEQVVWHETPGPALTPAGPHMATPASGNFGPPPAQAAPPARAAAPGRSLLPIPDPATMPPGQPPMLPSQGARPGAWQYPAQYRRQAPQYGGPPARPTFIGPPAIRSHYAPPGANGASMAPGEAAGAAAPGEWIVGDAPGAKPRRPFWSRWAAPRAGAETPKASSGSGDGPPAPRRFPFFARPAFGQPNLDPPPGMPEPPRGTGMDNFYPR